MADPVLPQHARVVVIGGGIIGCSTAYHLARDHKADVILLEQNRLTSGSTWHAAGLVGQLRSSASITQVLKYSVDLYKRLDAEVFTPDGFYPTGDLCRIDADDYLYFVARRNDMIKTRSANVSRLEVEAALNELPEVELAVVTGLDDAEFGQIVAAAVVPASGCTPSEDSLRAALREAISSYKVPRRIVFIEPGEIPRTATGKLKLHELAQLIEGRG